MVKAARSVNRPGKEVYVFFADQGYVEYLPPLVREKINSGASNANSIETKPIAFVCTGFVCSLPTSDPNILSELINKFGRN